MIFTPINKIIVGLKPTIFYYLVSENLEISNPICGLEEGRAARRARVSGHWLSFGMKGKVARPSWASLLGGLSAPCGGQGVEWQWKEARPSAFVRSLAGSPPQSPSEIIRETLTQKAGKAPAEQSALTHPMKGRTRRTLPYSEALETELLVGWFQRFVEV